MVGDKFEVKQLSKLFLYISFNRTNIGLVAVFPKIHDFMLRGPKVSIFRLVLNFSLYTGPIIGV